MKKPILLLAAAVLACTFGTPDARSQGMPAALHENIHALFDAHSKFTRKVTINETGYIATTESSDPKLAKILREHVSQMRDRLQSGGMVRRWDPAFPELTEHYDDITHRVEATKKGIRVTVTGKNPDAIKVAINHAKIVSDFTSNGWKAHDTHHPRALTTPNSQTAAAAAEAVTQCEACKKPAAPTACAACRKEFAAEKSQRPCCLKEDGSDK